MSKDECTTRGRGKVQRPIGSISARKHANLTANLTVQGQHVNDVFIQVYIRICTHCYNVRLIKYIFKDINPCLHFLADS
jgi:hypothetical protein